MAKIILRCNYMRKAPTEHLANLVSYLGTRIGAEPVDDGAGKLAATVKQKRLISQILRDIPDAKEMLEYADYLAEPTRENASEFISQALEYNLDFVSRRENYVDYLANRPRVERVGAHGLFTDEGAPVVLSQVQKEVAEHKGAVWTNVISLKREDAARLGYDHAEQWVQFIRCKKAMLSKNLKIDVANLRWYAAFHNEAHHPHLHLMVYSADPSEGYLSLKSIEAMRSELAHDIFRQDFAQIYEEQNVARKALKDEASEKLHQLTERLRYGVMDNPKIENDLLKLSARLQELDGKKQYVYMPKEVKQLIDGIVNELASDPKVAAAYAEWYKQRCEILQTYASTVPDPPPLSEQKEFKSIKNNVIAEAMKLDGHISFAEGNVSEPEISEALEAPVIPEITAPEEENCARPSAPAYEYAYNNPTPITTATNVLRAFALLLETQAEKMMVYRARSERKQLSRERQKKIAMGHAVDDRSPEQQY